MDEIPYLPKAEQQEILASPALSPPSGVTPNFANPPNQDAVAEATFVICLFFATFSFIVRMYARVVGIRPVHVEDVLTFFAYGTFIGYIYCCYWLLHEYGYFIHQWDLLFSDIIQITYILQIGGVLYSVTLPLLKASILLEWTRLFVPKGTRNVFWWLCMVVVAIQLSFLVASVLALCFTCIPYRKIWDFTLAGTCIRKSDLEITSAAIHFASDIVILSIPQRVIWTLQMSFKKKLGVSLIFSLGVLACLSALLRLISTIQYSISADVTYTVSAVILWALAEMTCGFIVLGMPTAPKVLLDTHLGRKIKSSLKSLRSSSAKSSTNGQGMATSKRTITTKLFRKADEPGTPLRMLKSTGTTDSMEQLRKKSIGNPEHSILCTTSLSTSEDYDYEHQEQKAQLQRQHPW
ncbi:hypothetical protein F5Y16DRAFT_357503 [Xylariaceae sp. FL0255]|nr:hypothetical protein F5Y16DRAFT_357503 [Xylariaceae sp. FL0255]